MPNVHFLSIALDTTQQLETLTAKSAVYAAAAKSQFEAGLFDETFKTIALIPLSPEKKAVLVDIVTSIVEKDVAAQELPRIFKILVSIAPDSCYVAGRLAQSALEKRKFTLAEQLLNAVVKPFYSDKERYFFVKTMTEKTAEANEVLVLRLMKKILPAFENEDYQDWAQFALMKWYAEMKRWKEAADIADSVQNLQRKSWLFLELAKTHRDPKEKYTFLKKSKEILLPISIKKNSAEKLAAQLRITGKTAMTMDFKEDGLELLERCEASAAQISAALQRFKQKLFLAKVLKEWKHIEMVKQYLAADEMLKTPLTNIERSFIFQWLAEAESGQAAKNWQAEALRCAAQKERKEIDESVRTERLVELIRRFSAANVPAQKPSGDVKTDEIRFSAEEFEEHYFSPFAVSDCDC